MVREELLAASDAVIDDAVAHVAPIVLRGVLYQLTGDEALAAIPHEGVPAGFLGAMPAIVDPDDVALLRAKAAGFLKAYRDAGAGDVPLVRERLARSMALAVGSEIGAGELELWIEQMALDPMARGFDWRRAPAPERRDGFFVAVIGAGMGGLNAAVQLKRAGIPFVVIEKNRQVGGTWHENRYPGARVDSASRTYCHAFGVGYPCPGPFNAQAVNEGYFNWVADHFDLRGHIVFGAEVKSAVWDEDAAAWDITAAGDDGPRRWRAHAVISSVGLLNRPHTPEIEGIEDFAGRIVHTARWPEGLDLTGKRVALIGSGATGYQTAPVLAGQAKRLTLFQRTPSWCVEAPGYLSTYPPQVTWLDRNFPYLTSFLRLQSCWTLGPETLRKMNEVVPGFDDPHTVSPFNKNVRDTCIAFMRRKLPGRPDLVEKMTPVAPPMSSRPVVVDSDNNIFDALMRDNVELVTEPIAEITPGGLRTADGREFPADVIVLASGFKPNELLWPMDVRGRGGASLEALWAPDGARAYIGVMLPGFPNFFMNYGPNTNPVSVGLGVVDLEEIATRFAMKCIEALILEGRSSVDVTGEAYERFNAELDRCEATKVYADKRVTNYYLNRHRRSAVNSPFDGRLLWAWLRDPVREPAAGGRDEVVRPYIGGDLFVE